MAATAPSADLMVGAPGGNSDLTASLLADDHLVDADDLFYGGPEEPSASSACLQSCAEGGRRCKARLGRLLLSSLGLQSSAELGKVGLFTLSAFLANAFFVIGRNIGTALFLTKGFGPDQLPAAMLVSGVLTVIAGQMLSGMSRGASSTKVYHYMLVLGFATLCALYAGVLFLQGVPPSLGGDGRPAEFYGAQIVSELLFAAIYVVEDILAMFVAMQCSTVAQSAFTVTDAKRLFGLVQLGNSFAAMSVGVFIGQIATALGTEQLVALQALVLASAVVPNMCIGRWYVDPSGGSKKKNKRKAADDTGKSDKWWHNLLVLAMGFWSFSVIFAKTMFEYEYNVLVVQEMTEAEMVQLTGYLYAGAGLLSSVVNSVGTKWCLEVIGVKGGILVTPGCLLSASLAILAQPSVWTTFAGRLVDLSLRWSINNTVRSVLWIAVPISQAVEAKPWVEGTIKKLGSSFNAMVISVVVACIGAGNMSSIVTALSISSLLVTGVMVVICFRVYSFYLESMWRRIKRRELRLAEVPYDAARGAAEAARRSIGNEREFEEDRLSKSLVSRLLYGAEAEQLYILRELGETLSKSEWESFYKHFYELPTAVQVRTIELGSKIKDRVPDNDLLDLIKFKNTKAPVVAVALLAASERRLYHGLVFMQQRLGSQAMAVRAAAAISILNMGWGVGLGSVSSAALLVVEQMLGFPLGLGVPGGTATFRQPSFRSPPGRHSGVLQQYDAVDSSQVQALHQQWEAAMRMGDTVHAVSIAIELTYAKLAVQRESSPRSSRSLSFSNAAGAQPSPPALGRKMTGPPFNERGLDTPPSTPMSRWERPLVLVSHADSPEDGKTAEAVVVADRGIDRGVERRGEQERDYTAMSIAMEMLKKLPDRGRQLLSLERLLRLLQHPSHKVRIAALALVREADSRSPEFNAVVKEIVHCLWLPDTYLAAAKAVSRLGSDHALMVQNEVLEQLKQAVEDTKRMAAERANVSLSPGATSELANGKNSGAKQSGRDRRGRENSEVLPSVRVMGLLKFLERQSLRYVESACFQDLCSSNICDELLDLTGELSDADARLQMCSTIVDLKALGFNMTRAVAEARARSVARTIFRGFAVQAWLRQLLGSPLPPAASLVLRDFVSVASTRAEDSGKNEKNISSADDDAIHLVLRIANRYIDEHIYLLKLQLLQMAVLAAGDTGAEEHHTHSTRVLAAWRVLRSNDPSQQAAVLEVLDSMLYWTAPALKSLVLPVLDDSPLDKKLAVGASTICQELKDVLGPDEVAAPSWMPEWLQLPAERLGVELGIVCRALVSYPDSGGSAGPPLSIEASDALLPKILLLSPLRLYTDLLATHVAEIATIATTLQVRPGQFHCQPGETYVVVSGLFQSRTCAKNFGRGDVIQELHALNRELIGQKVSCSSSDGGTVLRIREEDMFDLMYRLPPKFALGLLKSLVRVLPAPQQTGGSRTSRLASEVRDDGIPAPSPKPTPKLVVDEDLQEQDRNASKVAALPGQQSSDDIALYAAEQADATDSGLLKDGGEDEEEDPENASDSKEIGEEEGLLERAPQAEARRGREDATFSTREKLVLLQGVKIFRYVTMEYLPWIAQYCKPQFCEEGQEIFEEGKPTNATLYIVAEGTVGLFTTVRESRIQRQYSQQSGAAQERCLERRLLVGDSMGNTGLLADNNWQYSASALEDTWLLTISRTDLTDLLRGRRELASAVIRGLYKTFTRRMKQFSGLEGGGGSSQWLRTADYSRQFDSPMLAASKIVEEGCRPPSPLALPPTRE